MTDLFRKLPRNGLGRDFVIGDVHGAYDLVLLGMRSVGFNGKVDRLFSVGDLIDRGHQSARVRRFLQQPYVYATRGNHEEDFISLSVQELRLLSQINFNGLGWVKNLTDDEILEIQGALRKLPVAMEVDTARGSVGLVHAQVPKGLSWQTFVEEIKRGNKDVIQEAMCGRDRIESRDDSGVEGIGRVFVGHTVQYDGVQRLGNVYAIDTGAVFREIKDNPQTGLTMADLSCKTGVLVSTPKDIPLRLAEADDDAALTPFTNYARTTF